MASPAALLSAFERGRLGLLLRQHSDLFVTGLVVAIVGMMIVPLPTFALDLLLSFNIALAVVLLMVSIYVTDALRIAAFPSILLFATLFRLGLNISTTRLILRDADAGQIVRAFGEFVVSGDVVVGAVIFLILTLVQFIVIAKGAERVAEVAARFTLDAMPGKQMAIDADVRAGAIGHEQARQLRDGLQRESQLYGSMDGAMKFVKGDAIAGILITVVNIVGGLIVGIGLQGMTSGQAASVYTALTIGDGLVSQIPALIISLSAGIIVTRVASEDEGAHLGHDIVAQVLAHPRALAVAAVLLAVLAVIPGLPAAPFCLLAAGAGALAWSMRAGGSGSAPTQPATRTGLPARGGAADTAPPLQVGGLVPIALELAADLAHAVEAEPGADSFVTDTVPKLRDALYRDLGVVLPGVRVCRCVHLPPGQYTIRLWEVPVDTGRVDPTQVLVDHGSEDLAARSIPGQPAAHPGIGRPVTAVLASLTDAVGPLGAPMWDPAEQVAKRLAAVLRSRASEFVGIQETQWLLDELQKTHPVLVNEVVPKLLPIQLVADVLRRLVGEQVSIRDLRAVLEALAEWAPTEQDAVLLTEYVRSSLRRQISYAYAPGGALPVWLVDSLIEDTVRGAVQTTARGSYLALDPDTSRDILAAFRRCLSPAKGQAGAPAPVVLTTMEVRRYLRRLLEVEMPGITVLSFQELNSNVSIQPMGRVAVC
jgi:type III secretion protein V